MAAVTASQKFDEALQQMVDEKVFSLDALARIQKLKELVVAQEATISKNEATLRECHSEISRQRELLSERQEKITKLEAREIAIENRERQMHVVDQARAVAEAKAAAYRDSMSIVFAPNTVRQSVQTSGTRFGGTNSNPGYNGGTSDTTNENYNHNHSESRVEGYGQPIEGSVPQSTDGQGNRVL